MKEKKKKREMGLERNPGRQRRERMSVVSRRERQKKSEQQLSITAN